MYNVWRSRQSRETTPHLSRIHWVAHLSLLPKALDVIISVIKNSRQNGCMEEPLGVQESIVGRETRR